MARPIDNFATHNPADDAAAHRMRSVKDYGKDVNVNGWQEPGVVQSSVALQAQGYQLPPRSRPAVQKFPLGVSITQDPQFMDSPTRAAPKRAASIREQFPNNVHSQARFENDFSKPGVDRSPATHAALYLQAGPVHRGQRVNPARNVSSNARVFGSSDAAPRHPLSAQKPGKRLAAPQSSHNLISGHYGADPLTPADQNFKPYSGHHIRKPPASI